MLINRQIICRDRPPGLSVGCPEFNFVLYPAIKPPLCKGRWILRSKRRRDCDSRYIKKQSSRQPTAATLLYTRRAFIVFAVLRQVMQVGCPGFNFVFNPTEPRCAEDVAPYGFDLYFQNDMKPVGGGAGTSKLVRTPHRLPGI